jgi:hypothetical protein
MASIRKELELAVPAAQVWAAFKDVGAVHTRLAKGFVTDCRMDGAERIFGAQRPPGAPQRLVPGPGGG